MISSVSNDGIQWTLNFGPDSVTIAVNDLAQNITISSQEKPLAAWQLLLSQRQDFLNNHLARLPLTEDLEGFFWRDQLKTPMCWTKSKTMRTLLLLHQHRSLSDSRNRPGCGEVVLLEQE